MNWGAVVTFLTLPLVLFAFQMYHWTHPGWLSVPKLEQEHIGYLREFMRNITFLVFGLAGLRTWEQVKANGNPKPERPPLKNVHGTGE